MTITTTDQMVDALLNNSERIVVDKSSIANMAAGNFASLWQATGQPAAGATPTAAALCNKGLPGSFNFPDQVAPSTAYFGYLAGLCSNNATTVEFHDRIAHMGGLSGIVTTAQTAALNLHSSGLNPLAERIGDPAFNDIQWWLEVYTTMGATGVNATVNVTYHDGTTGNLTVLALGATPRAGRMYPLNGLNTSGKWIRAINNVTLSATTGTAGNFGFTATRRRVDIAIGLANSQSEKDFIALASGQLPNSSCLFMIMPCSTTSTGLLRMAGKLALG